METHDAPKKNNTLNTLGIVTVGVVGAVLVYVSIIGLQSFYVSETSEIADIKSFGAQGEVKSSLKAEQMGNISETRTKSKVGPDQTQLYSIGIDAGKKLIIRDVRDASRLVPAIGPSIKPTIAPAFGRPQPLPPAPPPPAPAAPPAIDPVTGLPVAPAPAAATPAPAAATPAAGTPASAAATPAAATPAAATPR